MPTISAYPSDVSDEEWAVALPYVTLLSPTALQRKHDLRAVFNAVRYLACPGVPWRALALFAQRLSAVAGDVAATAPLAGGGPL
jgi:transposase